MQQNTEQTQTPRFVLNQVANTIKQKEKSLTNSAGTIGYQCEKKK